MAAWYTRAWLGLSSPVLRAIGVGDGAKLPSLGADYAAFMPAVSLYDERLSTAATANFPWLAASLPRKASDLSRLPWSITRGGYGKRGTPAVGHPLIYILETPNSAEPGSLFWQQVYSELWKVGEAYAIKVRDGRGKWTGLIWCPSARIDPIVGPSGFPMSYRNMQTGQTWDAREIIHWRLPGSSDGPDHVTGTGAIEPLRQTLDAEYRLKQRLATASRQGRPSAIATPDDELGVMGKEQVAAVREELAGVFAKASGGVAILGRKLKVDQLDWSPTDLDAPTQLDRSRTEQLAVAGVPPVRVGLETANFATAEMQEIVYWGDELQGCSALVDDVLTMHARSEFGMPDLYVYRDFSGVPVLQKMRDQALDRVAKHIANGVDATEAYRMEGFDDVSVAPKPEIKAAPVVETPPADVPARSNVVPLRAEWWPEPVRRNVSSPIVVSRATDPRKAWSSWLAKVHTPEEIRIRRQVAGVFRAQQAEVLSNLDRLMPRRDFAADLVDAILPPGEDAQWWAGTRAALRHAVEAGVMDGASRAGFDPVVDVNRLDLVTDHQIAALVTNVDATTRDALRKAIGQMIAEGLTPGQMQTLIQSLPEFSPMRALRVARTEATKALATGGDFAYHQLADTGVKLQIQWLTAGFEVREAHQLLEGATVNLGEVFIIPSGPYKGQTARYPGDFAPAALSVNCRCTTLPLVVD